MMRCLAAFGLWLAMTAPVIACTCPAKTQDWWDNATAVALIRVDTVSVARQDFLTGKPCAKGVVEPCVLRQAARVTAIETFKGRVADRFALSSTHVDASCGKAVIAGAFYVVFLRSPRDFQLSLCNAAGPYAPDEPDSHGYPAYLERFVKSLRRASKRPPARIMDRPPPVGVGGG